MSEQVEKLLELLIEEQRKTNAFLGREHEVRETERLAKEITAEFARKRARGEK